MSTISVQCPHTPTLIQLNAFTCGIDSSPHWVHWVGSEIVHVVEMGCRWFVVCMEQSSGRSYPGDGCASRSCPSMGCLTTPPSVARVSPTCRHYLTSTSTQSLSPPTYPPRHWNPQLTSLLLSSFLLPQLSPPLTLPYSQLSIHHFYPTDSALTRSSATVPQQQL